MHLHTGEYVHTFIQALTHTVSDPHTLEAQCTHTQPDRDSDKPTHVTHISATSKSHPSRSPGPSCNGSKSISHSILACPEPEGENVLPSGLTPPGCLSLLCGVQPSVPPYAFSAGLCQPVEVQNDGQPSLHPSPLLWSRLYPMALQAWEEPGWSGPVWQRPLLDVRGITSQLRVLGERKNGK